MPYNPTHLRRTWQALGNPTDPVAFDVAGHQSGISLLKGLLASFGGPFLPDHSVSFDKLQQVVGPTVLGRGPGLGEVLPLPVGRGLDVAVDLVGAKLITTPDVALKSENNSWTGTNSFPGAVTVFDTGPFSIVNQSDSSKVLRFDVSTLPTGNTLRVRLPSVGLEGGPDVGYLGLLKSGNTFAQPLDDDLTAISGLTAVDTIYYRSHDNPPLWSPVVIGANLFFNQGTLSATGGGGGGGGVNTAGPVNASMLAAFADASGTLIQGVMVAGPGIAYASGLLQTTNDLRALENLTGTNTIYYRAATDTWSPVNVSTGLTFGSGVLAVGLTLAILSSLSPVADTVPYFTGTNAAALTAFTSFGRSLVGTADAAAGLTLLGAQAADGDLTALANLTGTNTIYYRSGTSAWSPVTIGANLTFGGGVLAATGGGGGGVTTSGPVTSAMLTGYADATGNLIRGITMPGAGIALAGAAMVLANDLSALEALSGSNTIYYRIGTDSWGPVTIGTNLSFAGGVLSATAGGGGVSTSGSVTASQLAGYADATGNLIRGINLPAAGIALSGNNMVLTNDLASLESASATGALYYRSASDTWTTVTVGGGLGFTTGNLTITNVALTALGTVTPAADRLPYFTGTTTAALAAFTAAGRTLLAQPDAASMVGVLGAQPLDGDLTSLSGATGTNTIYYRSAANTWSPVVVGTNLTFTGGTLAATGGGGDVFKNLANTFTAQNVFLNLGVVIGNASPILSLGLEIHGLTISASSAALSEWSNDPAFPTFQLNKSRGAGIGTHAAVGVSDLLGELQFNGSNGTSFITRAKISSSMSATTANAADMTFLTHNGTALAGRVRLFADGALAIDNALTATVPGGFTANQILIRQTAESQSNGLTISRSSGSVGAYIWTNAAGDLNLSSQPATGYVRLFNNFSTTSLATFGPAGCSLWGSNGSADQTTGYVGEFKTFRTTPGSALGAGGYTVAMTQSVPAGDWDLQGLVRVSGTAGSIMYVNLFTNVGSSGTAESTQTGILTSLGDCWTATPLVRVRQSAATNYNINVYMAAAGTLAEVIFTMRRRN